MQILRPAVHFKGQWLEVLCKIMILYLQLNKFGPSWRLGNNRGHLPFTDSFSTKNSWQQRRVVEESRKNIRNKGHQRKRDSCSLGVSKHVYVRSLFFNPIKVLAKCLVSEAQQWEFCHDVTKDGGKTSLNKTRSNLNLCPCLELKPSQPTVKLTLSHQAFFFFWGGGSSVSEYLCVSSFFILLKNKLACGIQDAILSLLRPPAVFKR